MLDNKTTLSFLLCSCLAVLHQDPPLLLLHNQLLQGHPPTLHLHLPHQPFYDCPSPDHTFTELSSPVPSGLSTFPPPPPSAPQHPMPSFDILLTSSTSTYSEEATLEVFRATVRVGQSGREPIPFTRKCTLPFPMQFQIVYIQ